MFRRFRPVMVALIASLTSLALYVGVAPYPRVRAEALFFRWVMPIPQRVLTPDRSPETGRVPEFVFESPRALRPLRDAYRLDDIVAGAATDFERQVRLMHWVRDRFPHGVPATQPDVDAFDGLTLLREYRTGGYLCGTAVNLLVQSITAVGGFARRVDLRFTPEDSHVVAEGWSAHYGKWVVLDPDYDLYFTVAAIPQGALELHALWAAGRVDDVDTHPRDSPHNIYRKDKEGGDRSFVRMIYETRDFPRWDRERRDHRDARFAVKLLHYYSHVSFPWRNDWLSRPLPWWHPEGNHVQNAVVVQLPSMPDWDDFLRRAATPDPLRRAPAHPAESPRPGRPSTVPTTHNASADPVR